MEQRLTQGVYGNEFNQSGALIFGLHCGQIRGNDIVHNGGWYNSRGEKLGWGDLSAEDLVRIATELADHEVFVILPERASFWNFVQHNPGPLGSNAVTDVTEQAPGVDYIAQECLYLIKQGVIYAVARHMSDTTGNFSHRGVTMTRLAPELVLPMLQSIA